MQGPKKERVLKTVPGCRASAEVPDTDSDKNDLPK